MLSEEVIKALREKFSNVNPLIFHRCLERAKSDGDLFDILDTMPKKYPIMWSDDLHKWVTTKDLFQSKNFPFKEQE